LSLISRWEAFACREWCRSRPFARRQQVQPGGLLWPVLQLGTAHKSADDSGEITVSRCKFLWFPRADITA